MKDFRKVGEEMACLALSVGVNELDYAVGFSEKAASSQAFTCKVAALVADVLADAGHGDTAPWFVYRKLADGQVDHAVAAKFISPVVEAMGAERIKTAGSLLPKAVSTAAGMAPGMLQAITLAAIGAGGGLGAGYWALNHAVNTDPAKVEALEDRAEKYEAALAELERRKLRRLLREDADAR